MVLRNYCMDEVDGQIIGRPTLCQFLTVCMCSQSHYRIHPVFHKFSKVLIINYARALPTVILNCHSQQNTLAISIWLLFTVACSTVYKTRVDIVLPACSTFQLLPREYSPSKGYLGVSAAGAAWPTYRIEYDEVSVKRNKEA